MLSTCDWCRFGLNKATSGEILNCLYTRVHIFWYWAIRRIFTVMRRLRTGTTIIGARRSKGHTKPANLANLRKRVVAAACVCQMLNWVKSLTKIKCQFTYFLITLLASIFSCIQSKLWPVLSPLRNTTSSFQDLSSLPPRETLGTRLVWVMLQIAISLSWSC